MVLNLRVGPTLSSASNNGYKPQRHSNDINRRKTSSKIDMENAKLAARLNKVRGGNAKLPPSAKRRPRRKPGASGHGGSTMFDSGHTMEQEWRKYEQKTAMDDRADDWVHAVAANSRRGSSALPADATKMAGEYASEADELAAMEEECRLRLIEEQQKAVGMLWTG